MRPGVRLVDEARRSFFFAFPRLEIPQHCDVAKGKLNISLSQELRDEFERSRRTKGTFDTTAEFIASAMAAYVLQIRRGEEPAYPLEFVLGGNDGVPLTPGTKAEARPGKKARLAQRAKKKQEA